MTRSFHPQVWICPLVTTPSGIIEYVAWLDQHELKRYRAFGHVAAATRFLVGRAVLKSTLGRLLEVDPSDVELRYSPNGKPFISHDALHFSISHCAQAVAVIVAQQPVGIDLEQVHRPRAPWTRPQSFLHPTEAQVVAALPQAEQPEAFALRWTCQEAAIKLQDASIFDSQSRVCFERSPRTGTLDAGTLDTQGPSDKPDPSDKPGPLVKLGTCKGTPVHFASWRLCAQTARVEALETPATIPSGLVLSVAAHRLLESPLASPFESLEFSRWTS